MGVASCLLHKVKCHSCGSLVEGGSEEGVVLHGVLVHGCVHVAMVNFVYCHLGDEE